MKKIITILILAAAPVMFAQEKAAKGAKEQIKTEQQAKQKNKVKQAEVNKKAKAEKVEKKAVKTTEVKAVESKGPKKQSLATQEKRK